MIAGTVGVGGGSRTRSRWSMQRRRFLVKVGENRGKSTQPTIIVKRFEHGPIKNIGGEGTCPLSPPGSPLMGQ